MIGKSLMDIWAFMSQVFEGLVNFSLGVSKGKFGAQLSWLFVTCFDTYRRLSQCDNATLSCKALLWCIAFVYRNPLKVSAC